MDRYSFYRDSLNPEPCYCDIDVTKDGCYVLYSDHVARVAELKAALAAAREYIAGDDIAVDAGGGQSMLNRIDATLKGEGNGE